MESEFGALWDRALFTFTTMFAMVDPVGCAAIFAAITPRATPQRRRRMATKGAVIALAILVIFALAGRAALDQLGISLAALRTAGGVLLMIMAIDMVFATHSGATATTENEEAEARAKDDVSVFPLATPLVAGPGAMGVAILLMADARGDLLAEAVVVAGIVCVVAITWFALMAATQVTRVLGVTGLGVVSRVLGVVLAALAVQFIFDGLKASGVFAPPPSPF